MSAVDYVEDRSYYCLEGEQESNPYLTGPSSKRCPSYKENTAPNTITMNGNCYQRIGQPADQPQYAEV